MTNESDLQLAVGELIFSKGSMKAAIAALGRKPVLSKVCVLEEICLDKRVMRRIMQSEWHQRYKCSW